MFFHSSSNELRTKVLVWFWIGIMGCSLSRFKVQALTHWHMGTAATLLLEWKHSTPSLQMYFLLSSNRVAAVRRSDCQFRNSRSTFFACIKHVHITSSYNMLSSRRCQIMSVHVQSCSNFETQWSGPTPALPPSRIGSWELGAFQV